MHPGAPDASMGVIFCSSHTLKCCLSAIRKFVQFGSSISIRVLLTPNMCWHGRNVWTSRARRCTRLRGVPANNREEILLLATLISSKPGPSLCEDPLIRAWIQVQIMKWLPWTRHSILCVTDEETFKSLPLLLSVISILQEGLFNLKHMRAMQQARSNDSSSLKMPCCPRLACLAVLLLVWKLEIESVSPSY